MTKLIKLNQTFEKIGFATDSYLGFLSVNPENLGTGLKIEASIKLTSKANFAELEKSFNELLLHTKYISVNVENLNGDGLLVHLKSG
jgi:protein-arginine kinase